MAARNCSNDLNRFLHRFNGSALIMIGALTAVTVGLNRLTLALKPQERPTQAELAFVQEVTDLAGESVTEREMLDNLSKTKRAIANGYKLCKGFERKGYRSKPEKLEQALLEKSQDVRDYGMAALNNLCPELKG